MQEYANIEDFIAIGLALLVGSLIGFERQFRDKAAGLRTMICICMGATLFTLMSFRLAPNDPVRIAANIVTGVGFLGAGVILRDGGRVLGVTTAAVIWLTAALGMAIAAGARMLVAFTTLLTLLVLLLFRHLSHFIDVIHEERSYAVTVTHGGIPEVESLFAEAGLHCLHREYSRDTQVFSCTWHMAGTKRAHQQAVDALIARPDLKLLRF